MKLTSSAFENGNKLDAVTVGRRWWDAGGGTSVTGTSVTGDVGDRHHDTIPACSRSVARACESLNTEH